MEAALFNPLPEREKELLAALSLFETFSGAEAVFVGDMADAEDILRKLMESNGFITRQESGGAYKLHHMFREVVRENFGKLPPERRRQVIRRAGLAHLRGKDYIAANRMFYAAGDFENLLLSLEEDYGASLAGEHKAEFLSWVRDCPRELLREHPIAMLICARHLYMYNRKAACGETLEDLRRVLAENVRLSGQERDNLLGEVEIAASFLCYNDAVAMGVHFKRALELMDRPTNSVSLVVPWTYGTPSVFAAYHRKSGEADAEKAVMKEAMPTWYKLNRHHGAGAEHLFEGELHFLRGNFTDGIISLHRARHEAKQNRQPVMALAADFLRLRIETFGGSFESVEPTLQTMRGLADEHRLPMLLHTADICEAWIYALAGKPDKAASWMAEGNLENTRVMYPGVHFLHMAYCQLLLSQGEYAALIAQEYEKRALYRVYPTLLCEIYLDIQLAAAYERLGRRESAVTHLMRALEMAAPDQIYLPFAENGSYIAGPLRDIAGGSFRSYIERILALYAQNRLEKKESPYLSEAKPSLDILSEREATIARLAAGGMSNKEIAAELFISESRVKGQLSGIFQKLGIANGRDKRGALAAMFPAETDIVNSE
jgi:LuxR family maltose regulon positive regulatory protein